MLLALGAIGLVAIGILIALLLTRDDNNNKEATTVVITSQPLTTTAAATTTPGAPAAAKLEVPDLVGRQAAEAKAALQKLGLQAALTSVTDAKPPGTVVDQQPPGGSKARKGAVVTLSIARASTTATTSTSTGTTTSTTGTTTTAAPANATVPDVTGQSESAAVSALSRAGILPSLVFVPGSDPLGTVLQQAKQSGTTVPYHAHVQINLSRGPGEKEDEQVPTVVGRSLTDAVSAVNAANLRLIYVRFPVSTSSQVGKIVQQSPLGGGKAPHNAQVLVFLGTRAQ
jgi:serine/threonine-protein kinase